MAFFALCVPCVSLSVAAEEPPALFEAGQNGYASYRIPGVVVTAKGSVLAYCEARKNSASDWGHIEIALRRSTDGGKTFSPIQLLTPPEGKLERNPAAIAKKAGKDGEITLNNPLAIASKSGAIHLLYCVEYMRCFYARSDDDGATFSKAVEITAAFDVLKPAYAWTVLATGPGHGIEMKNGRLLVPVWLSLGTGGGAHRPSAVSTIYSDDGGKSWHAGGIVCNNSESIINPNETCAVQLADGRVMLNMRSESKPNRRAVAFSADGSSNWSKPEFVEELKEPICFASMITTENPARIYFSNPDNLESSKMPTPKPGQGRDRKNLSLKVSADDGKSWTLSRVIDAGPSGYSDLAALPDGILLCFYERGAPTKSLVLMRFAAGK